MIRNPRSLRFRLLSCFLPYSILLIRSVFLVERSILYWPNTPLDDLVNSYLYYVRVSNIPFRLFMSIYLSGTVPSGTSIQFRRLVVELSTPLEFGVHFSSLILDLEYHHTVSQRQLGPTSVFDFVFVYPYPFSLVKLSRKFYPRGP